MPEGDSVVLVARKLEARLSGLVLAHTDFRHPRWATADLSGRRVLTTVPRGKHLLTRLDDGTTLHTHLRMDGSWTVLAPGKVLPRRVQPQVRVQLRTRTDDGEPGPTAVALSMPVVELLETRLEHRAVGHLGPDVLGPDWDAAEAARRLVARPERALVAALLDQRCLAGLGNLWVNELAFLRGTSPWAPVGSVELGPLLELAHRMLRRSADVPGAYQVTTGSRRPGQTHWVAGRAGRGCLRCGTTVRVVAETPGDAERRRTWWCPRCQPAP